MTQKQNVRNVMLERIFYKIDFDFWPQLIQRLKRLYHQNIHIPK